MTDLTREAIAEVDGDGLLEDILGLPDQLRDALWRVESANLEPRDTPGGLVVAGMGGSAIGGLLAQSALGDRASRPIVLARSYELPAWTTPDTTVLCASYSGGTEETLAVYDAAGALGARRIVATTGGTFWTRLCSPSTGKRAIQMPSSQTFTCGVPHANTNTDRISQGIQPFMTAPEGSFWLVVSVSGPRKSWVWSRLKRISGL